MKYFIISAFFTTLCMLSYSSAALSEKQNSSTQSILEDVMGMPAEVYEDENIIRFNFPRTDIKATVQRFPLAPFMGLSTSISFKQINKDVLLVMGDLLLLEHEINPVMDVLLRNKIQISALHNHFIFDNPKLYFMHIYVEGKVNVLNLAFSDLMRALKTKMVPSQPLLPLYNDIKSNIIEKIIGIEGIEKDGMYKIVIGRPIKTPSGLIVGKNMGINTWVVFSGVNKNAFIDGDFAVLENELQDVLKSLRANNIAIAGIHNHMINESPRLIFVHFWGHGPVEALARAFKAALEKTKTAIAN